MKPLAVTLILALLSFAVSAQQSDCPSFIETALLRVHDLCAGTARNQACYGNLQLTAEAQPGVTQFVFDQPGDVVNVIDIQQLSLSALNVNDAVWGIAFLQLQANLPDTLPGQNVTVLLFGDVSLLADETAADGAPLQAFYLRTGIGDAPCAAMPDSGVLIQSPAGAARIELTINGAHIALGSTAYIQAHETLDIFLLEGQAAVTAAETTLLVPAGTFVSVPLDEAGVASAAPGDLQPYGAQFAALFPPLIETLPESITAAAEVCALTAGATVNVRGGPGTAYDVVSQLAAGQTALASGQAAGTDGLTWWQIGVLRWVRSDVVEESGNCDSLPVVTDLPALPTPVPTPASAPAGGSGGLSYFNLNGPGTCVANPPLYQVGRRYLISFGRATPTGEAADAAVAAGTSSISINGVVVNATRQRADCPADGAGGTCTPGDPGYWTQFVWVPTAPGTYTIVGSGEGMDSVCTITIEG
ncbi:MAG: hypothetical protein HXY40_10665 [Chloroflexi bacterium]|nr:hypothetical protein [Chloroflexota bacterium]